MSWAREVFGDDFVDDITGPMAGSVDEDDLVFKPRVRAALGQSLVALLAVAAFFVPVLLGASSSDQVPDVPFAWFFVLYENMELLFIFTPALAPVVKVLTTRYVLGPDGLRERSQFLSKTERRVSWEKVTALRQRRSVFDRMLGIERLDVIAYGQRGATIHLVGLPDAAPLRDHVARQMRRNASVDSLFRSD